MFACCCKKKVTKIDPVTEPVTGLKRESSEAELQDFSGS